MKSTFSRHALFFTAFLLCASLTAYAQDDGANDEKAIKSFSGLLKGVSAAKAHLSDIHQLTATTPYPQQTMVVVSRQLLAWGWKPEDAITILRACANTGAGISADDSKFTKIALLVGRLTDDKQSPYIALSGLDDLGIPAWQMIAKLTGKSIDQSKRYAQGTELTTKRAFDVIIAGLNELYGGAAEREAQKVKSGIPETPTPAPSTTSTSNAPPTTSTPSAPAPAAKEEKKTCFFGGTVIPCSKN